MERLIVSIAFSFVSAVLLIICSLKAVNILQLSSYRSKGIIQWLKRTRFDFFIRCFALGFFSFAVTFVFCMCFPKNFVRYFGMLFYVLLAVYFIVLQAREKQKTPLKFTKRVIRLLILLAILYALTAFLCIYFLLDTPIGYSLLGVLAMLIPFLTMLAQIVILPLEKLINRYYLCKAKKKLKAVDIIKIGITGSYGKTTAKNILTALLSSKYKVLSSPSSHNTPMGLSKLINNGLNGYEVLIAEMGARRVGDIAELCNLIEPDYGIITTVGSQHFETFGSIENVLKTKFELADSCKTCVINSDDTRLMGACALCGERSKFLYSGVMGADAGYKDIEVSMDGTSFWINIYGKSVCIKTRLLGRHIAPLFTQCALLAFKLDISLDEIADAALKIEPVEHRLQLIKTANGAVIDDAYNSNPEGARNALEVLSMFSGNRVVVTPGFVELGTIEVQKNYELGGQIKANADYLICIKNNDILNGALKSGMEESRIFLVNSLTEAALKLEELSLDTQIVLFLNDLPDNY